MGDRAQVKVGGVYLYTHWNGTELKSAVRRALSRKERWDDEAYLARIVFCEMLALEGKNALTETTGLGISAIEIDDNQHPLITLDCETQTVTVGHEMAILMEDFIKDQPC